MLKNNGKMIIGRNFLLCLCVICLMFTAFGLTAENSFAVELNDTVGEMGLESDNVGKLENSQNNEILEVSQDSNDILGATIEPKEKTYKSIRQAVKSANNGDTIKLSGTYYASGDEVITINKPLTITADSTATLNGNHLSMAFAIEESGAGTVINNIKFIYGNGKAGSCIFVKAKNVKITDCIFEDNHAPQFGAVNTLYDLDAPAGLIVDNCQFRRNNAYYPGFANATCGAGLSMYGRDSEVKNSIFEDNWVKGTDSSFGGAIQVGLDLPGSNSKVTNCIFKNNRAIAIMGNSHGGAGCVRQGTVYSNCLFINNYADEGGALTFHSSGLIKNCTFLENNAGLYGGALSTGYLYEYMELNVVDCNFEGNSAPIGGAIQANGVNIIIDNSNFKNNHVTENGGAIHIKAEDVTIMNSVFNSNWANVDGGAVYIEGKNTVVQDSLFVSNEAIPDVEKINDGLGGAIYIDSSQAFIKNNSFRFNTARNGSAIYYDESGDRLMLENNELFQNQAWVYQLPISAKDIYYQDSQRVIVTLIGGNNIGDFDNLAVSNAIYNDAGSANIVIDNQYPLFGATNSGDLYQDSREYNINVLLTIRHEDGTLIYNEVGHTDYLGEIVVDLDNLKPGKYYVDAKHYEDNYYKAINNQTTFMVYPKVDNEVTKSVSKTVADFEEVINWTISVTNHGPNNSTNVTVYDVLPDGLIWLNDTSEGRYNPKTGMLIIGDLNVDEKFTFSIISIINKTGAIVNKVNVTAGEFDVNTTNNYDESSLFVNPSSDLAVFKRVSNSQPNYRDYIIWTIEIVNNGPDTAHDVEMFDILPDELIYVDSNQEYDELSGIWKVGTLQSGDRIILNIQCIVNSTGLIENAVRVNATEFDYDLSNNNDSERIFVDSASDLAIIKSVNASNVNFMDIVKWTLTITNRGPDAATNVEVYDFLPDGFTYIDSAMTKGNYSDGIFSIANLDVNEDVTIEILTLVEATGDFINYANVTSDEYDYNLTNNEDDEDIHVNPCADLIVTKSVSNDTARFNDIITWTIDVLNDGPDIAHNVTIYDLLPDSLVWIGDDSSDEYDPLTGLLFVEELGVGESYTLNIDCRVNATGLLVNNVSVNASEYDYNLTNNFDNDTVEVEKSADVSVIKLVNNSSPNYNDLVMWTLIISNNGPDKATNVYVEDQLPEGLILIYYNATKGFYDQGIWAMCCLNNGESQRLEIICRVNKTRQITNIATIHADEYDYNESNNIDNETIDVPLAVDIQVIIKANNTGPLFGEKVNWMITVKNNGPDNATGVFLHEILPPELIFSDCTSSNGIYEDNIWNIGSLNVGDAVYLNITTVSNALGILANKVNVNSTEYDWRMSNNRAEDKINVKPVADLAIIKSADKTYPKYGETVKWTVIVTNNGPNVANNVVVSDILPKGLTLIRTSGRYTDGSWKIDRLNAGESKQLVMVCKVTSTGTFINFASVKADEYDPDDSNNHANKSIFVSPASDLSITKIASKYNYKVGDVIEYVIEIVNNGPDTARNIKVNEILNDLLKLKSFKVTRGNFNKFTNVWTIKSLGYGESARLYIKAIALGSGIIKNTVEVTSDTFDYDKSNNKDFAIVNVSDSLNKKSVPCENGNSLVNLEKHPTANPFLMLLVCLLISIIFSRSEFSKKR